MFASYIRMYGEKSFSPFASARERRLFYFQAHILAFSCCSSSSSSFSFSSCSLFADSVPLEFHSSRAIAHDKVAARTE